MTAAHTPGPWRVGGVSMHTGAQHIIAGKLVIADAHAGVSAMDPALTAQTANAHLIAAAPELYAAAERALNFCLNSQSEVGIAPASDDEMEVTKLLRAALAKARAAQ